MESPGVAAYKFTNIDVRKTMRQILVAWNSPTRKPILNSTCAVGGADPASRRRALVLHVTGAVARIRGIGRQSLPKCVGPPLWNPPIEQ